MYGVQKEKYTGENKGLITPQEKRIILSIQTIKQLEKCQQLIRNNLIKCQ